MEAGVDHVTIGVALFTVKFTLPYPLGPTPKGDWVKVALSVTMPAVGIVPAAGLYVNVPLAGAPDTVAVASNCVADSAVPYVIAVGVGHCRDPLN